MDDGFLFIAILIVIDITLWVAGTMLSLSRAGRFRINSCAFLVLCLIFAALLGWKNAAMLSFAGLWIAALAVAGGGGATTGQGKAS